MKKTFLIFVFSIFCAVGFIKIGFSEPEQKPASAIKIIDSRSGDDSRIPEKRYYRILNKNDFVKLWQEHKGSTAGMPKVDFKSQMVVAIFWGKTENCAGINLNKIIETIGVIEFHFSPMEYQTAGPEGWVNEVQPYGFFVIPYSTKRLILIQDLYSKVGPRKTQVVKNFERIG